MPEIWIDEHTSDETIARPEFRASLRADLAKELATEPRRRTPWRAMGWAAAVAAAAVTTVVVVGNDDTGRRVAPGATTTTPDPTTPTTGTPTSVPTPNGDTLQIPASGGPALSPSLLASFDIPDGFDTALVAVLPDRVVLALVVDGRYEGTIVSFDRAGNRLPDTRLDVARTDQAGLVLGGLDGTLYVETFAEVGNTQTTTAHVLDGDVWREVASYVVEQNNDGVYSVSGDGLMIGGEVVIPAQTVIAAPNLNVRYPDSGSTVFEVQRSSDGSTTTWRVEEAFENFGLPPAAQPYAGGAVFEGNRSGEEGQRYVAVLRAGAVSEFFRPNGWSLVGADDSSAVFASFVNGSLRLGALGGVAQLDWSTSKVLGFPMGFSSVDKVLSGVNPVLGDPTADGGWFVVEPIAPGDEDCLAGVELRVLHWGDLTIAFRKALTPDGIEGELMWSWVVGDLRSSGFDSFRGPVTAPGGMASGVRTEDGFGVGTSMDDLAIAGDVALSAFTNTDGSLSGNFTPRGNRDDTFRGIVVDAEGTLIGLGSTQSFC